MSEFHQNHISEKGYFAVFLYEECVKIPTKIE